MAKNGRTQFAPTIEIFIIDLKFTPQQTPPLPKGRGTVEDGGGILKFNDRRKTNNIVGQGLAPAVGCGI